MSEDTLHAEICYVHQTVRNMLRAATACRDMLRTSGLLQQGLWPFLQVLQPCAPDAPATVGGHAGPRVHSAPTRPPENAGKQ